MENLEGGFNHPTKPAGLNLFSSHASVTEKAVVHCWNIIGVKILKTLTPQATEKSAVSITQRIKRENQSLDRNQWTCQGKGQVVKKAAPLCS